MLNVPVDIAKIQQDLYALDARTRAMPFFEEAKQLLTVIFASCLLTNVKAKQDRLAKAVEDLANAYFPVAQSELIPANPRRSWGAQDIKKTPLLSQSVSLCSYLKNADELVFWLSEPDIISILLEELEGQIKALSAILAADFAHLLGHQEQLHDLLKKVQTEIAPETKTKKSPTRYSWIRVAELNNLIRAIIAEVTVNLVHLPPQPLMACKVLEAAVSQVSRSFDQKSGYFTRELELTRKMLQVPALVNGNAGQKYQERAAVAPGHLSRLKKALNWLAKKLGFDKPFATTSLAQAMGNFILQTHSTMLEMMKADIPIKTSTGHIANMVFGSTPAAFPGVSQDLTTPVSSPSPTSSSRGSSPSQSEGSRDEDALKTTAGFLHRLWTTRARSGSSPVTFASGNNAKGTHATTLDFFQNPEFCFKCKA